MKLKALWIMISRQVKEKFTTFLISSGGIVIGIWAITLTSSLSFGLSNTIVTAINSQPSARTLTIEKTDDFGITTGETFQEYNDLKKRHPEIVDIIPSEFISINLYDTSEVSLSEMIEQIKEKYPEKYEQYKDVLESDQLQNIDLSQFSDAKNSTFLTIQSRVFQQFFEENKSNWVGSKEIPKKDEIVLCYSCNILKINEKFGIDNPEDFIGKEVEISFTDSTFFDPDSEADSNDVEEREGFLNGTFLNGFKEEKIKKYKVVAVVDDRDISIFSNDNPIYMDFQNFIEARKEIDPTTNVDNLKFDIGHVFLNSFDDMEPMVEKLESEGYTVTAEYLDVVKGVQTAFVVIAFILGGFGFIALIASIFGIVNVMTISVLERKKQIGILKSLGAKGRSIFFIFLAESVMLGVIGWCIGTALAVGMGYLTAIISRNLIASQSWGESLTELNIEEFAPGFPLILFLVTFVIAILVTSISGLIPAVRAGRQNPVDVLRSE